MVLPEDVADYVRDVFATCDARVTERLSNNPNSPEEHLDLSWIEHVSEFGTALTLPSHWTVKIDVHYLGGLRHFVGRWEIADIGILVFFRRGAKVEKSKVALLQSKRLYPTNRSIEEEGIVDYQVGFARLADPEVLDRSISVSAEFQFADNSKYGALTNGSNQVTSITQFEKQSKIPVYYQFYNPWSVPFSQRIPLTSRPRYNGMPDLGIRILPSNFVHGIMAQQGRSSSPTLQDMKPFSPEYGWTLSDFMVEQLLACTEGSRFESISDDRIQNLFYRRSGPIAAAIAVSIEAPE